MILLLEAYVLIQYTLGKMYKEIDILNAFPINTQELSEEISPIRPLTQVEEC